ncbi:MAG: gamma-glutamylcyclotransferase family protein [Pseudomonadota bacterium]
MNHQDKLREINEKRWQGDYGSQLEAIFEQMYSVSERLFVYGTLKPNEKNAHVLADVSGRWEKATINAILHTQGFGGGQGDPGVVISHSEREVPGLLLTSPDLPYAWASIDAFEGEEYVRLLCIAKAKTGVECIANVYGVGLDHLKRS